jgi:hypothetical protein
MAGSSDPEVFAVLACCAGIGDLVTAVRDISDEHLTDRLVDL